jgi:molecular chaperone Hsp33
LRYGVEVASAADEAGAPGADAPVEPADEIIRSLLADRPVRVVAVTTTGVAREAARRHEAQPAAALALARGMTAGLLLATLTKDEERVTLQVLGDGPLGGLTVDASSAGRVRAYVKNPELALQLPLAIHGHGRESLGSAVGTGVVSVIRDVGLGENFSGQTAIASGEIDEDVEHYLQASEQIPSVLACDAMLDPDGRIAFAAGVLVQALPGSFAAEEVEAARELLAGGELRRAFARGPQDAEQLLTAAFEGRLGDIQLLDRRPVSFRCPCSRGRAAGSLALLGEVELASMIVDDGQAEVVCNFCRARYHFDDAELENIRRDTAKPSGPPS